MKAKCNLNNKNQNCDYQEKIVHKSKITDDELLNVFFAELASLEFQQGDNVFAKLKQKIQDTFDLEKLKENGNLDKEIKSSNLNKKQKSELQTIRINQERIIIRYNEIKEGIEEETKIDRLRDFQFWYMQIVNSANLIEKLKNEIQTLRKKKLDFLANYIAEFNRIQQEIQDETDIERLKDFWLREIAKSKLETSDKAKLNELRKECIRELEQSQPGSNDFNRIKNGISNEKKIPALETNRFWFREIRNSKNLTEQQKVTLNIQRSERLKTLSN